MSKNVFMYCRKSSEGEDKQMMSIPSQLAELKKIAKLRNLNIVKTFEESRSAKSPGRPKFADMMARLIKKEAAGVLCWKLDRLARNPIDGGSIMWAVKNHNVEIITQGQTYTPGDDTTLLMYVEFGMAQKYVDDLGKNSKRGMLTKAEIGWYPAPAPIGYLNTPDRRKGFKVIKSDPDSNSLVKRCFEEVMRGRQAIDVWREAHDVWQLRGKRGLPISESAFYFMLNNPFYYGEFEWPQGSGTWYSGKHEPIVSRDEFDLVQKSLGKFGKPIARSQIHTFDLTGLMRCGECGCAITATKKMKYYRGTNRTAYYTYYHCTHKSQRVKCRQPPISEHKINDQLNALLDSLKPPQDFIDWAKQWLHVVHQDQSQKSEITINLQQKALSRIEKMLNKLLDMHISDQLGEKTYKDKKRELEKEKRNIEERLKDSARSSSNHRQTIEEALDFAHVAKDKFVTGTRTEKQEILLAIGSNPTLLNKKVRIDLHNHFTVLSNHENWEQKYSISLEPQKYTDTLSKYPELTPANPIWLHSPPNILYKLFPREAVARVQLQLQVLHDLLETDTQYQKMEVNNGTFWKLPLPAKK